MITHCLLTISAITAQPFLSLWQGNQIVEFGASLATTGQGRSKRYCARGEALKC
jgi:hypothetical protein